MAAAPVRAASRYGPRWLICGEARNFPSGCEIKRAKPVEVPRKGATKRCSAEAARCRRAMAKRDAGGN